MPSRDRQTLSQHYHPQVNATHDGSVKFTNKRDNKNLPRAMPEPPVSEPEEIVSNPGPLKKFSVTSGNFYQQSNSSAVSELLGRGGARKISKM
jgi:hypothetical protein